MTPLLLAAAQDREASPIALVVILFLLVALVLLIRSMNKHLRKLPATFPHRDERGRLLSSGPAGQEPEAPDGTGGNGSPDQQDRRA